MVSFQARSSLLLHHLMLLLLLLQLLLLHEVLQALLLLHLDSRRRERELLLQMLLLLRHRRRDHRRVRRFCRGLHGLHPVSLSFTTLPSCQAMLRPTIPSFLPRASARATSRSLYIHGRFVAPQFFRNSFK